MRLDDITIGAYIELQCGDYSVLGDCKDKDKIANTLTEEYNDIVNPASAKIKVSKSGKRIKLAMRMQCAEMCLALIEGGGMEEAISSMNGIGYNCTKDNVKIKADGVISECRYMLDRMDMESGKEQKEQTPEEIRGSYTRERSFLMTYNKLYIDKNIMSASEYAYIVVQTKEDIDARMKAYQKR